MSDAKTEAYETRPATSDDPWAEATEAYLTAAATFAETLQACWMAGANAAIDSLQSGLDALPEPDATSAAANPLGGT
jgi:surface antigen